MSVCKFFSRFLFYFLLTAPIFTKFAQKHLWDEGIQFFHMKGQVLGIFKEVDKEMANIYLTTGSFKNFLQNKPFHKYLFESILALHKKGCLVSSHKSPGCYTRGGNSKCGIFFFKSMGIKILIPLQNHLAIARLTWQKSSLSKRYLSLFSYTMEDYSALANIPWQLWNILNQWSTSKVNVYSTWQKALNPRV